VILLDDEYVLQMQHITKNYGSNQVLYDVSISVKPGEIHALMGENGAGKSTLMNILFGMSMIHSTGGYEGTVLINGEEVKIMSPQQAMEAGIGMVHQEFMLIPGFTVTENIKIGREITTPTIASLVFGKDLEKLDRKKMAQDARQALNTIGMDIDENTRLGTLPVGYMQFVEIAREIDKTGVKLLVFDEPTAVLTESEAERLLEVMRMISSKGIAIIFITHRLREVMDTADSMTVLRDGECVARRTISETNEIEIAELMVGRKIEKLVDDSVKTYDLAGSRVVVSIKDLVVDMPSERVRNVSLDILEGEIFGIGGLAGQGKVGIVNGLMGMYPALGEITVMGEYLELDKLGDAIHKGFAFVSEDRRGVGLLLDESIENNIVFNAINIKKEYLSNFGITKLINTRAIRRHAQEMIRILDIRCTGPQQKTGSLSGGNQQKVCLAGALTLNPRVLMVSEPTRGIDIGAKKLILEYLVKLREKEKTTIIIISSELAELRSICDRIAIVSDGRISEILKPDASDADFGLAMSNLRVGGDQK